MAALIVAEPGGGPPHGGSPLLTQGVRGAWGAEEAGASSRVRTRTASGQRRARGAMAAHGSKGEPPSGVYLEVFSSLYLHRLGIDGIPRELHQVGASAPTWCNRGAPAPLSPAAPPHQAAAAPGPRRGGGGAAPTGGAASPGCRRSGPSARRARAARR